MIEALMLFGSAARGDSDANSDIDMLAVNEHGKPFTRKISNFELQIMQFSDLFSMAQRGDLFAIHLCLEGKVIVDRRGLFPLIRNSLIIKTSYKTEISWAIDLAKYLLEFGASKDLPLVNKRIAWCVRTIAIASLMEQNKPIFSPRLLAQEFQAPFFSDLIGLRRSTQDDLHRNNKLSSFLEYFNSKPRKKYSESDYYRIFKETNNAVGYGTFKKLNSTFKKNGLSKSLYPPS
ncbi:anti-phage Hailong system nucleotidyltransferase HalB [Asaia bogorensis]|uniref:anti-phage Hailong system nucleotidyltransferase HalB n=1 Tax=Asaia bogorensis TaxID=91915 RepID=UPI002865DDE8|nr:nucleotidyltransferase domain-containing protein [Asaia bogorensis]MDR6182769.1 hypothetical protein [Asaia bogorensis NBRC 16594]